MATRDEVQAAVTALRQQCGGIEPAVHAMKSHSPKVAKHLHNAINELEKAADELQKELDAIPDIDTTANFVA